MFITDTTDAIYPPENWSSRSLIDRLAEIVRNYSPEKKKVRPDSLVQRNKKWILIKKQMKMEPTVPISNTTPELRRPFLIGNYPSNLETFLSHISIASYESLYSTRGKIDWIAIEDSLLLDIFGEI